jgi:hypothetical protein
MKLFDYPDSLFLPLYIGFYTFQHARTYAIQRLYVRRLIYGLGSPTNLIVCRISSQ